MSFCSCVGSSLVLGGLWDLGPGGGGRDVWTYVLLTEKNKGHLGAPWILDVRNRLTLREWHHRLKNVRGVRRTGAFLHFFFFNFYLEFPLSMRVTLNKTNKRIKQKQKKQGQHTTTNTKLTTQNKTI